MVDPVATVRDAPLRDDTAEPPAEFAEALFAELRHRLDGTAVGGTGGIDRPSPPARWRRSGGAAAIAAVASLLVMGGLVWLAPAAQPNGEFEPLQLLTERSPAIDEPAATAATPTAPTAPIVLSNPEGYRFAGWRVVPSSQFEGRRAAAAVWTGSHLFVWGGELPGAGTRPEAGWPASNDGGVFNPAAGFWVGLPPAPLPGQAGASALWTGEEMLVVGGPTSDRESSGAAFDPGAQSWRPLPAPAVPFGAAAVWTGDEAILWGGDTGGAAYDPQVDSWRPLPAVPGTDWRPGADAIWTGSEMIVWNDIVRGSQATALDVAAYDPVRDAWRRFTPSDDAYELSDVTGVWSGEELILWGVDHGPRVGSEHDGQPRLAGVALHPANDRWRVVAPAPFAALEQFDEYGFNRAVWTGSRMLVWVAALSGVGPEIWSYDPVADEWESGAGAPLAGGGPTLLWTGETLFTYSRSYFVPLTRQLKLAGSESVVSR